MVDNDNRIATWKRRNFLKTAGTATALGTVAGCLGGGGGSSSGYTFTSATPDTMAFALASEFANVVTDETDIELNSEASSGSKEATSQLVQGGTDIAYAASLAINRAVNREGDFAELEFEQEIMQVMSYYWIQLGLVAPVSSDIQTMSDLDNVTWTSGTRGATFQELLFRAIGHVHDEETIDETFTDVDYGQLSDALSSGEVQVSGGPLNINESAPSYIQQLYSQNDVRLLGWTEDAIEAIQDDDLLTGEYIPNDVYAEAGVEEFAMEDESFLIVADHLMITNQNISEDDVYEMMNAVWGVREELQEAHAGFSVWAEDEFWTAYIMPDVPVHPGAVKFYKEKDMWNDDWVEGSL